MPRQQILASQGTHGSTLQSTQCTGRMCPIDLVLGQFRILQDLVAADVKQSG